MSTPEYALRCPSADSTASRTSATPRPPTRLHPPQHVLPHPLLRAAKLARISLDPGVASSTSDHSPSSRVLSLLHSPNEANVTGSVAPRSHTHSIRPAPRAAQKRTDPPESATQSPAPLRPRRVRDRIHDPVVNRPKFPIVFAYPRVRHHTEAPALIAPSCASSCFPAVMPSQRQSASIPSPR